MKKQSSLQKLLIAKRDVSTSRKTLPFRVLFDTFSNGKSFVPIGFISDWFAHPTSIGSCSTSSPGQSGARHEVDAPVSGRRECVGVGPSCNPIAIALATSFVRGVVGSIGTSCVLGLVLV